MEDLKLLLGERNLKPNFTYGQNFLVDKNILEEIVKTASVSKQDQILEIGPGIGNLTRELCQKAGFVLSVEKDPKFLPILKSVKCDFPDNFRYEIADALEFNFQKVFLSPFKTGEELKKGYKVVANIPYYITGKILEMLMTPLCRFSASAEKNYRGSSSEALAKKDMKATGGKPPNLRPTSITILTQEEVAERVCAKAGDMSVLAISVQIYGEPKIIRKVPASSFYPSPKVNSAILQIDLSKKTKYQIKNEKIFFRTVKACFAGKRKQIHNTLVNNLGLKKNFVLEILRKLNIDPKTRPQELSIEQWVKLAEILGHEFFTR